MDKAEADGDFSASLVADPKAAIAAATGMPIPDGFEIVVYEDGATTAHLVLPPSPALTDAELEAVVGGVGYADWNPFPPS